MSAPSSWPPAVGEAYWCDFLRMSVEEVRQDDVTCRVTDGIEVRQIVITADGWRRGLNQGMRREVEVHP